MPILTDADHAYIDAHAAYLRNPNDATRAAMDLAAKEVRRAERRKLTEEIWKALIQAGMLAPDVKWSDARALIERKLKEHDANSER